MGKKQRERQREGDTTRSGMGHKVREGSHLNTNRQTEKERIKETERKGRCKKHKKGKKRKRKKDGTVLW